MLTDSSLLMFRPEGLHTLQSHLTVAADLHGLPLTPLQFSDKLELDAKRACASSEAAQVRRTMERDGVRPLLPTTPKLSLQRTQIAAQR